MSTSVNTNGSTIHLWKSTFSLTLVTRWWRCSFSPPSSPPPTLLLLSPLVQEWMRCEKEKALAKIDQRCKCPVQSLDTRLKKKNNFFPLPLSLLPSEHYLIDVTWIDDRTLGVLWSRRSYNRTVLSVCRQEEGWTCEKVKKERKKETQPTHQQQAAWVMHTLHPSDQLNMDKLFTSDESCVCVYSPSPLILLMISFHHLIQLSRINC